LNDFRQLALVPKTTTPLGSGNLADFFNYVRPAPAVRRVAKKSACGIIGTPRKPGKIG
jgi:hypothetical protein